MRAQDLASWSLAFFLTYTVGCKESQTCGPGTHTEQGQCVPNVPMVAQSAAPPSAPSASSLASTAPSAAPVAEKPQGVRDLEALIAVAKDQFRSIQGPPADVTPDKHELYRTSLPLEGCLQPSIWKRPTGEWEYRCGIVPNKNGQRERQVVELLHQRLDELEPAIPPDWKIERHRAAEPYLPQFRAIDPTAQIVLSAHVVPRADNSFDASFQVTWFPTPQKK